MAYAARHPGEDRHLVLVDSARAEDPGHGVPLQERLPGDVEREDGYAFASELGDEKALSDDMRDLSRDDRLPAERMRKRSSRAPRGMVYRQAVNKASLGGSAALRLNPELAKFRFPTLVVTGRYDFNVARRWLAIHKAIRLAIHRVREERASALHRGAGRLSWRAGGRS
jgi:proline iminopeptidase